jgi:hypothetical protein
LFRWSVRDNHEPPITNQTLVIHASFLTCNGS